MNLLLKTAALALLTSTFIQYGTPLMAQTDNEAPSPNYSPDCRAMTRALVLGRVDGGEFGWTFGRCWGFVIKAQTAAFAAPVMGFVP